MAREFSAGTQGSVRGSMAIHFTSLTGTFYPWRSGSSPLDSSRGILNLHFERHYSSRPRSCAYPALSVGQILSRSHHRISLVRLSLYVKLPPELSMRHTNSNMKPDHSELYGPRPGKRKHRQRRWSLLWRIPSSTFFFRIVEGYSPRVIAGVFFGY